MHPAFPVAKGRGWDPAVTEMQSKAPVLWAGSAD